MQAYEQIDIDTIRRRTQHGMPITQEQQRWLVEQVIGPLEGKKTRCPLCQGEGRLYSSVLDADCCTVTRWLDCDQCGGDGYILEQPKSDTGKKYGITADRLDIMVIEDMQDYFRHEFGKIPDWLEKHDGRPLYQTVRMALCFCLLSREETGIEADICREIARRQKMGKSKYGQQLLDNPADIAERLQHLKEELLDGAIYCQWAMRKLKG